MGRKRKQTAMDKLTPKQQTLVREYTNPKKDTYLRQDKAAMVAYDCGSKRTAEVLGSRALKNENVQLAIREALHTPKIDKLLEKGILERLENPQSRHWQPTADFVAKIRGDFAPEKQVQVNLTPDQRDDKYAEILKLVKNQKGETPEEEEICSSE